MKKEMVQRFILTLILVIINCIFNINIYAETLLLKSGKKVEGKIIEKSDKYIKVNISGLLVTYGINEVAQIEGVDVQISSKTKDSAALLTSPINIEDIYVEALTYYEKKNYEATVETSLKALEIYAQKSKEPNIIIAQLHYLLVDSYNEIGQKHYFSKELCLRIIYHTEKFLEINPNTPKKDEIMEFLRKTIGHFDIADSGAIMMEMGGDGKEFQLPPDNINQKEKLSYKDKAIQRLKNYDASKPSLYKIETTQKSIEDITEALSKDTTKISSIHCRMINAYMGKKDIMAEFIFEKPDKFKTIQQNQTLIFIGNSIYSINPKTNKIIETREAGKEGINYFGALRKGNISNLRRYYDLSLHKIQVCPDFLKALYKDKEPMNLYLITAKTRKEEKDSDYLINKLEYVVDLDYNLIVAEREYWLGILGSGREEDLAKETVVKEVKKYGDDLYLPLEVTVRGYVEEASDLKEDVYLEILSLNKDINDSEFDINRYK